MITLNNPSSGLILSNPDRLTTLKEVARIIDSPVGGLLEIEWGIEGRTLVLFGQAGRCQIGIGNVDLETWDFLTNESKAIGSQDICGNWVPDTQVISNRQLINDVVMHFFDTGNIMTSECWDHRETN
jgi:hypothetical protein